MRLHSEAVLKSNQITRIRRDYLQKGMRDYFTAHPQQRLHIARALVSSGETARLAQKATCHGDQFSADNRVPSGDDYSAASTF